MAAMTDNTVGMVRSSEAYKDRLADYGSNKSEFYISIFGSAVFTEQ